MYSIHLISATAYKENQIQLKISVSLLPFYMDISGAQNYM